MRNNNNIMYTYQKNHIIIFVIGPDAICSDYYYYVEIGHSTAAVIDTYIIIYIIYLHSAAPEEQYTT